MFNVLILSIVITISLLTLSMEDTVAIVKTLKGTVKVLHKGDSKKTSLKVGSQLKENDTIFTSAESSIGITFDEGTTISLDENSLLRIKKFKVDPKNNEYDVDLSLEKGKAMFNSGKIGKLAPQSVKFHIPLGVIGIRGTSFIAEAS